MLRGGRCSCLYELENGLRRTKYCFVACSAQKQILKEREELKKIAEEQKMKNKNK